MWNLSITQAVLLAAGVTSFCVTLWWLSTAAPILETTRHRLVPVDVHDEAHNTAIIGPRSSEPTAASIPAAAITASHQFDDRDHAFAAGRQLDIKERSMPTSSCRRSWRSRWFLETAIGEMYFRV